MSMQEQEPRSQNIIPPPSERGSARWSWRKALIGAGVAPILWVGATYIAPLMVGLSPEFMSLKVQTDLGVMSFRELLIIAGAPIIPAGFMVGGTYSR